MPAFLSSPLRHAALPVLGITTLFLAARAGAQPAPVSAYELIDQGFGKYVDRTTPLPWSMKVRALAKGPYEFWRGSRDVFYAHAKADYADWLADAEAYVPSHGDVHFGNVGSYPTSLTGDLAFGLVDFDDASRLPFQLDLMSVFVSTLLLADDRSIAVPEPVARELLTAVFKAYTDGIKSGKTASELLASNPAVRATLDDANKKYKKELAKFVDDARPGTFREVVSKNGVATDAMLPFDRFDKKQLAGAFADAVARDPAMAGTLAYSTERQFDDAILAVASRVRLASSGSQGLLKIMVLMKSPLRGVDGNAILYLKQQVPTAAERQQAVPPEPGTPGQRCVRLMNQLVHPAHAFSGSCEVGGLSFWLTLKEPWSDELDGSTVGSFDDLQNYAVVAATALGAAHHVDDATANRLSAKLTPQLEQLILQRSQAYFQTVNDEWSKFIEDPRVKPLRRQGDEEYRRFNSVAREGRAGGIP